MSEFESRKIYVAGEEGSPLPSKTGAPVRIEEIRAKHSRDNLYTDLDFPAELSSLGDIGGDDARALKMVPLVEKYTWERAHDLLKSDGLPDAVRPEFVIAVDDKGDLRCCENDVGQGGLGDCWFVAALAELTKKPAECAFVVPVDNFNGFDDDKYCGAFHFRFYVVADDKWVDVVVDDWLPVHPAGGPAFAKIKNELTPGRAVFWVALAEKAYAKLHGSYKGIEGGHPAHALENLCGGFAEIVRCNAMDFHGLSYSDDGPLADPAKALKKFLLTYVHTSNFMALDTYTREDKGFAEVEDGYAGGKGLAPGHAYSILDVQEIRVKGAGAGADSEPKVLVQLRNPWGHDEWKGSYGDGDDAGWAALEKDLRAGAKRDEGVFWMEVTDLLKYGYDVEICHFGLTDGTKLSRVKGTWPATLQKMPDAEEGDDYIGLTTGYRFEVKQGEIGAKYADVSGGKALVCFALVLEGYVAGLQPDPRFEVWLYNLADNPTATLRDLKLERPYRKIATVGREASCWIFVRPGTYMLVPVLRTTPWPGRTKAFPPEFEGKDMKYALRVFAENKVDFETISENKAG